MKKVFLSLTLIASLLTIANAQTWTAHAINYGTPLFGYDVGAVSSQVAWTTGIGGDFSSSPWNFTYDGHSVARTMDGGQTWSVSQYPSSGAGFTSNLCVVNENIAFITYIDFSDGNKCFKTTDGGQSWNPVNMPIDVWINFVHMFNGSIGVAMGDPDSLGFQVCISLNGGNDWNRISNLPAPISDEFGWSDVFCVADNHVWFATSQNRIYHSSNMGVSWSVFSIDPGLSAGLSFDAMAFKTDGSGIVALNDYSDTVNFIHHTRLLYTPDGGTSWQNRTPADDAYAVSALQYIPGTQTLIGLFRHNNANGAFETRISYNNGDTWTTIDTGTPLFKLNFLSSTIGWACEYKNDGQSPSYAYQYTGSPLTGLLDPKPLDIDLTLSPNPTAGRLNIQAKSGPADTYLLLINDSKGQLVYQETIQNEAQFKREIDLSNEASGIFQLTISSAKGISCKTFVKQ